MQVYLINPSDVAFGIGVITPRWLYVLAAATPSDFGDPRTVDETLEPFDFTQIQRGDVVGIGIHTLNALRGYEDGRKAREQGAYTLRVGSDDEVGMTSLANVDLYSDLPSKLAGAWSGSRHPIGFYRRVGFSLVGVIPDANGPGKPDIILAKPLR